jgi:TolA-binding protein
MSIEALSRMSHPIHPHLADDELMRSTEDTSGPSSTVEVDPGTSDLLVGGDMSARIAALVIRSAHNQRTANRDIQVAEEMAVERSEQQQVAALHQKADDIRMAGLIDGAAGTASGLFTMGGGFTDDSLEKATFAGADKISDASGKALGGMLRADQADDDANATAHEHEAAHHRRNFDAARDAAGEAQDLLESALDFYKESQQSAAETTKSSIGRS